MEKSKPPGQGIRNQIVRDAIAEGVTDFETVRQRLAAAGIVIPDDVIRYRLDKYYRQFEEKTLPRVYADACRVPMLIGIGVYCEEPRIEHTRKKICTGMTNNAAECEAVLDAIRLAKKAGMSHFLVCSDSQLAVYWVSGSYAQKSETAKKYTPKMRLALKRANARLIWVSGKENPADRLSRLAVGIDTALPPLERVIQAKMEAIRFADFVELQVHDQFSMLSLDKLREQAKPTDNKSAKDVFRKPDDVAECLRWTLRGLPIDKAIKKIKTDKTYKRQERAMERSMERSMRMDEYSGY